MYDSNKHLIRLFWIICFSGIPITTVIAQENTNRIRSLKQLTSTYFKPLESQTDPDNLLLATDATNLSGKLKNNRGEKHAEFRIGRNYAEGKNGKQELVKEFEYFSSRKKIRQALESSYIVGLGFKPGAPEYESAKLFRAKMFPECKEPREKPEMNKTELAFASQWQRLESNQFNKASVYLDSLPSQDKAFMPLAIQEEWALMRFRVDSARGRYSDAITHLLENKLLHDSAFTEIKNKQFEELKIQYETEKKNKDIEFLTRQSLLQASTLKQERLQFKHESEIKKRELEQVAYESNKKDNELKIAQYETEKKNNAIKIKDQNMQLLRKLYQLKTAALQKIMLLRNVFIAGAVMLLFLLGVIYNRYRQNRKTTRLLQEQQEIINQTNHELQQLNGRQFKLLTEKEWLVKEIHHRVKNNLQMMISLLNTQAEFLNNPSALDAIRESRERMQAIVILHKKLYQAQNTTQINIRSYINELVENIKDSMAGPQQCVFDLNIANGQMDVSQLIPLGLIINEAITNAIKHAYPDHEKGNIYISLTQTSSDELQLSIADNGQGLPAGMDADRSNTLGLQLIRLFSEQLEGELYFINNDGLEIVLNFKTDPYGDTITNRGYSINNLSAYERQSTDR
jgi:two-component sensor histidine kinase